MSRKNTSHAATPCKHPSLSFKPSTHARESGYIRPTSQQRATAAGQTKKEFNDGWDESFPAPLVLPGDELSMDPRCPPQSLQSWVRLKERNEVTRRRNVIYVARAPEIDDSINHIKRWNQPKSPDQNLGTNNGVETATSGIQDVANYLAAFYHGMEVKLLPPGLRFTSWEDGKPRRRDSKGGLNFEEISRIGLTTSTETVGIRYRPSPDGIFEGQLNLDDILDVAISILPEDAYALLMLVDQDMYEDEDDDFCCGRAYGGSRVALVSAARYNPILDQQQGVQREHLWPACHCEKYMIACCDAAERPREGERKKAIDEQLYSIDDVSPSTQISPLHAAVSARAIRPPKTPTLQYQQHLLWLPRIAQTAAHELGHCFGIAHCTYYACVMQATSSIVEDLRQPPYLCPVDEAKVARATGQGKKERLEAMGGFCKGHGSYGMFAALGAWANARFGELEGRDEPDAKRQKTVSKGASRQTPIELSP